MAKETRATRALSKAGIAFTIHLYDYDPAAAHIGLQAAEALGEPPERVFKTLMTLVDGKPACAIVPASSEVAMKKFAAALSAKSAAMMKPADAERLSGYKVGGISPFGQMKPIRAVIDESALAQPHIYLNGGQRGLQLCLAPDQAIVALGATVAAITA